jgi:hypothetical protein
MNFNVMQPRTAIFTKLLHYFATLASLSSNALLGAARFVRRGMAKSAASAVSPRQGGGGTKHAADYYLFVWLSLLSPLLRRMQPIRIL